MSDRREDIDALSAEVQGNWVDIVQDPPDVAPEWAVERFVP